MAKSGNIEDKIIKAARETAQGGPVNSLSVAQRHKLNPAHVWQTLEKHDKWTRIHDRVFLEVDA